MQIFPHDNKVGIFTMSIYDAKLSPRVLSRSDPIEDKSNSTILIVADLILIEIVFFTTAIDFAKNLPETTQDIVLSCIAIATSLITQFMFWRHLFNNNKKTIWTRLALQLASALFIVSTGYPQINAITALTTSSLLLIYIVLGTKVYRY